MLLRPPPRLRSLKSVAALFIFGSVLLWLYNCNSTPEYPPLRDDLNSASYAPHDAPPGEPKKQNLGRVFIAANHWNSEKLLRSHWVDALLGLIEHLGRENVYFSSYESGSWDNTKSVLRELDAKLESMGVARRILLDLKTHLEEIEKGPVSGNTEGWIETPRGKKELRRIPYLAKARNIVLEPLEDKAIQNSTHGFDYVLFLNDVIFTPEDALRLMYTRRGKYAAACSLDFVTSYNYYDTFALRALDGRQTASLVYPYFGPGKSRDTLLRREVVPVKSCWNGMVSFKAEPFVSSTHLRFRGISDDLATYHLEGSECCLIHADNPLSNGQGVFLNPYVRVTYGKPGVYEASQTWPTLWESFYGWFIRMQTWIFNFPWRDKKIIERVKKWGGKEDGVDCLIDEMQVLVYNGWAHV